VKALTKTVDCVFLDYTIHSVGYRFLIINSGVPDMVVGTIMESKDAIFFENNFFMKNTPSTSSHDSIFVPETSEPVIHVDVETHDEIPKEDNNIVA
jgi:hypothetical protein